MVSALTLKPRISINLTKKKKDQFIPKIENILYAVSWKPNSAGTLSEKSVFLGLFSFHVPYDKSGELSSFFCLRQA